MSHISTSLRFGAVAFVGAAALTFSTTAPAIAAGGANAGCSAFCPSGVGEPSGNGSATNQPAAGTVGNADDKAPPGQSLNDPNNGYECDGGQGVGNSNPAHSRYAGCR